MSKRWEAFWLVIATLACGLAVLPSLVVAILSLVVFDREGSLLNPFTWIAFLLMISLWIICILAPFAAWVMFSRRESRLAWTLISVPPIWAGVMGLTLLFLPG